jgi:hypothetical protein
MKLLASCFWFWLTSFSSHVRRDSMLAFCAHEILENKYSGAWTFIARLVRAP